MVMFLSEYFNRILYFKIHILSSDFFNFGVWATMAMLRACPWISDKGSFLAVLSVQRTTWDVGNRDRVSGMQEKF